jgi:BirA family biotin operon repressor/biotin-[acetyl-CoA-carboxylase] ligase
MPERSFRFAHFVELGSTNDEAMARARAGDPGHLWISAERQTSGRGRQSRPWSSPSGNLYASLLLIDPSPPALAPQLGFVAGVALIDALRTVTPDVPVALKWPNDVLSTGAKLAGILLEGTSLPSGGFACVIGCGVNCAAHPDNLSYAATDLAERGAMVGAGALLAALSASFATWLDIWSAGGNFAAIREAWLARAAGLGGPVRARLPRGEIEGIFETIDETGRLVLHGPNGRVTIDAGDVFLDHGLRPAQQQQAAAKGAPDR